MSPAHRDPGESGEGERGVCLKKWPIYEEEIPHMLAELRMKIETDGEKLDYRQSSNMQGVLMEYIRTEYAEKLHEQGIKPYSQYLLNGAEWVVKTCTAQAYQELILPLMDSGFTSFKIEKKDIHVTVKEKRLNTIKKKDLLEEFYLGESSHYLNLEFLTAASFKSNGKYVIMPEMRYIYQSLMNKYSASSDSMEMYDGRTLEQLVDNSSIVRYRLRSTCFPLEGVKIPSFIGEIGIRINGTDTMARYVKLLMRFGEYSGVGIKTAMGMGALKIKEKGKDT